MVKKEKQIEEIKELLLRKKVLALRSIVDRAGTSDRTTQRYLKELTCLTSYTHRGQFVTLSDTPCFDDNGIWFYQQIGFSKFGNSLETIIRLVNKSERGYSREELEEILKIGISKQIQILVQRERIHRVKLGNRYLYIPEVVSDDRKKRFKIVGQHQAEERFDKAVRMTDLIALLKVVLIENRIGIEIKSLKRLAQKYSLKIPLKKIQQLLLNYDLLKKKKPWR